MELLHKLIDPTNCQHKHIVITSSKFFALKDDVLGGGFPNLLSSDEFDKSMSLPERFTSASRALKWHSSIKIILLGKNI
jgi:hypothetical protein